MNDEINAETIVLLDLNYTLVSNSLVKRSPFIRQIDGETYRQWLVDYLNKIGCIVLIVTARPDHYRKATVDRIKAETGWSPAHCYFNTTNQPPPSAKRSALQLRIHRKFGAGARYVAIESNPRTVTMYAEFGIPSLRAVEASNVANECGSPANGIAVDLRSVGGGVLRRYG